MNTAAHQLIATLRLEPLPGEGGFFRQTWRSNTASAIVFLLTPDNFSALHRLAQDEMWHFHAGDPVEHVQLDSRTGAVCIRRIGSDVLAGDEPLVLVPAGVWQGARIATQRIEHAPASEHGFALLGCTVSPPWDEQQFELGRRAELLAAFPSAASLVQALTR